MGNIVSFFFAPSDPCVPTTNSKFLNRPIPGLERNHRKRHASVVSYGNCGLNLLYSSKLSIFEVSGGLNLFSVRSSLFSTGWFFRGTPSGFRNCIFQSRLGKLLYAAVSWKNKVKFNSRLEIWFFRKSQILEFCSTILLRLLLCKLIFPPRLVSMKTSRSIFPGVPKTNSKFSKRPILNLKRNNCKRNAAVVSYENWGLNLLQNSKLSLFEVF